jgi:predicted unusual protein kinase regulating ubiquinone biosynthesis (AarF/ABC1/UbiB family)
VTHVTNDTLDKGRLRRAYRLSKLGARIAAQRGRGILSGDSAAIHAEVAKTLVQELGRLKGLPMKIGQILSYMEGVVPDDVREIYQEALGSLRTYASPIAPAVCLRVLEQELGAPPDEVFERFDPTPIAVASIGQVYRAQLSGREVVVKVQYPDIAEATLNDLKNVDAIIGLMRTVMPRVDTRQMVEDFRQRLKEECDYLQEASYQTRFCAIYERDPDIVIPGVIESHSTSHVLTSEFVEGVPLDVFVKDATSEERDRAGQALFRVAFGTLLQEGLFHADPHPGNLLFRVGSASRLGMLDFGCVQPVDVPARRDLGLLLRAAIDRDDLLEPVQRALGIEDIDPTTASVVVQLTELVLAPILAPQPYRFTRAFATDIARAVVDAKMNLAARYLTHRGRFRVGREGVMFIVRNLFGLASIWGTLEAKGDYRALAESMVHP